MNKITNFLCLSLLLLGATVLGMNNPNEQLLFAAHRGDLGGVETLIAQGASVNMKDAIECGPLYYAALSGHGAVCKLLIKEKALVNAQSHIGWTPLRIASMNGREGVCKLLIDVQLEEARKDKAAIVTFLGIVKKRGKNLPCHMHYDVAKIIDRQAFEIVRQKNWSVIKQINKLKDQAKTKWLAYVNQQMNLVNK
jgi:ankyrin repeat protein